MSSTARPRKRPTPRVRAGKVPCPVCRSRPRCSRCGRETVARWDGYLGTYRRRCLGCERPQHLCGCSAIPCDQCEATGIVLGMVQTRVAPGEGRV